MSEFAGVRHTIVETLCRTFNSGRTLPLDNRKKYLQSLVKLLQENSVELCEATYRDVGKCTTETDLLEILFVVAEAKNAISQLNEWAKPKKVSRNLLQAWDAAYVAKQPLGVVLIVGAWNEPIRTLLCPLIGAIAAGNCAVLRPSESAPNTAHLLAVLLEKYMGQLVVSVVKGGPPETAELLTDRFDKIFFMGPPSAVGRSILTAASEHFTPVILQLGSKCPVIVDETADVALSARRIARGKFMACGQTFVAPDYVFCHESVKNRLVLELVKCVFEFYGADPQKSPDYGRIIDQNHYDRIMKLTNNGTVVVGGTGDPADFYISPTILDDVVPGDLIMQEEIFGPILPVLMYANIDEALKCISEREKPLALYLFTKSRSMVDDVLRRTLSGGVTINDVSMHTSLETLPFGGVGQSGVQGKFCFDCFSHDRSILHRPQTGEKFQQLFYPPYDRLKLRCAKKLLARHSARYVTAAYIILFFVFGMYVSKVS